MCMHPQNIYLFLNFFKSIMNVGFIFILYKIFINRWIVGATIKACKLSGCHLVAYEGDKAIFDDILASMCYAPPPSSSALASHTLAFDNDDALIQLLNNLASANKFEFSIFFLHFHSFIVKEICEDLFKFKHMVIVNHFCIIMMAIMSLPTLFVLLPYAKSATQVMDAS